MKPITRPPALARRGLLIGSAAWLALPGSTTRAQTRALRPTPAQTEGPFYPVKLPADTDFDLLAQGSTHYERGQATWVEGTVVDTTGRPLKDGVVEIWQCDEQGHYHHPGDGGRADAAFQGFGRVTLGAAGEYRFRTIRPVAYTGRTPHIHVKVKSANRTLLTTQLYVEGDPGNGRDFLWRGMAAPDRAAVTVPFEPVADGLRARFALVVG